ncbi:MAG: hypothetical protein KGZ83_03330 [Sulfuricella sp.]|nr:hypothetical protein [Sulfuricella sp.]
MTDSAVVAFYRGQPDNLGRTWDEILAQDDEWLECRHDFIQWLFPLATPSRANLSAPLLGPADIDAFRTDPLLRRKLLLSLDRMLRFYGLKRTDGGIAKDAAWGQRKKNWFVRPTHNNLRITRVLKSLAVLGGESEAGQFLAALRKLVRAEPDAGVGADALEYWEGALR